MYVFSVEMKVDIYFIYNISLLKMLLLRDDVNKIVIGNIVK